MDTALKKGARSCLESILPPHCFSRLHSPDLATPDTSKPFDGVTASRLLKEALLVVSGTKLGREEKATVHGVLDGLVREYRDEMLPYIGSYTLARVAQELKDFRVESNVSLVRDARLVAQILSNIDVRNTDRLYGVVLRDGVFQVTVPGLRMQNPNESGEFYLVGRSTKSFTNPESAYDYAVACRIDALETREINCYRKGAQDRGLASDIKRFNTGAIAVTFTGLRLQPDIVTFPNWSKAKERLDLSFLNAEQVGGSSAKIKLGRRSHFAVSALDRYWTTPSIASKPSELPVGIRDYIIKCEKIVTESGTSQKTISEPAWQAKLFSFIEKYLERPDVNIKSDLRINDLRLLSPRQAAQLCVRIVEELFKYNHDSVNSKGLTREDRMSVLQILTEGLSYKSKSNSEKAAWRGNGVCRNAAIAVKALFECIKDKQYANNFLQNTYCLVDSGHSYAMLDQKSLNGHATKDAQIPSAHAWNVFVTNTNAGVDTTIVDATWTAQDRQAGKLGKKFKDFSSVRALPLLMAQFNSIPDDDNRLWDAAYTIHKYIDSAFAEIADPSNGLKEEFATPYLARQALLLETRVNSGVFDESRIKDAMIRFPDYFDEKCLVTYLQYYSNQNDETARAVCKALLAGKSRTEYHVNAFKFKDPALQQVVIDVLREDGSFSAFVESSPSFRILVRDCSPQLLPKFSPSTSNIDFLELYSRFDKFIHTGINPLSAERHKSKAVLTEVLAGRARKYLIRTYANRYQSTLTEDQIGDDWLKYLS